ncbi:MAG: potassium channel protein [Phycisphaerales bacterium]|nr:potassium channel protein [Phycisphaerales bacterium]
MHELIDPIVWVDSKPSWRTRLRGQWLYLRAIFRRFRVRLLLLAFVLLGGTLLFMQYPADPGKPVGFFEGLYYTWCLVFFQPVVGYPDSWMLQVLVFVVPILGLLILVETFMEISLTLRDRRHNEREWSRMIAAEMKDHVVLVGCGRLGFRTLGHLLKMRMPVVIIESDEKNPFLDTARAQHIPVLLGNGRDDRLLVDAHIERAKSIICCTNDDLANLEIALDARRMNADIRVVLRMFDQNLANKIRDGFNIQVAFSAAAMAAPSFAAAATDRSIKTSFMVDGQLVVVSRVQVRAGSGLAGRTIGELADLLPLHVVAHQPDGQKARTFPAMDTTLRAEDLLLVQLKFEDIDRLRELNAARRASPASK